MKKKQDGLKWLRGYGLRILPWMGWSVDGLKSLHFWGWVEVSMGWNVWLPFWQPTPSLVMDNHAIVNRCKFQNFSSNVYIIMANVHFVRKKKYCTFKIKLFHWRTSFGNSRQTERARTTLRHFPANRLCPKTTSVRLRQADHANKYSAHSGKC
jgi:hypothetical protein